MNARANDTIGRFCVENDEVPHWCALLRERDEGKVRRRVEEDVHRGGDDGVLRMCDDLRVQVTVLNGRMKYYI